jgi:ureidoglycolate lyase
MTTETKQTITLKAEPLTPEAYAPFGGIVDAGKLQLHCSEGQYTARLMTLEPAPKRISRVNRHFDHSQLFVPLTNDPMLLVVAPGHVSGERFDPSTIRVFQTDGTQAFTFNVGVWHIAPRALDGKTNAQVINVQGSRYQQNTELIDFEASTGVGVEWES